MSKIGSNKADDSTRKLLRMLIRAFLYSSSVVSLALAQGTTTVTPTSGIGALGTTVTAHGNTLQITGGTRPGNGANLFHSFDQFNVGHGDTAQFLNTTPSLPTMSLLGRVTGGNPSAIFGTIDTMSYPGANLFLMNPAGIIFGPNATLNIGGSVSFTTADYIRLSAANGSNAGIFHTNTAATSLLTSAPVLAYGFLSPNPQAINVQGGTLTIQPGQSITLVGGNITVQSGTLGNSADPPPSAPGKQVLIGSAASPGEMLAGTLAPASNINGQSLGTFGTVQISQGSRIDTRGIDGGTIHIRGGQLVIDKSIIGSNTGDILLAGNSILSKNSAQIITLTTTAANAGHITLSASGNIDLDTAEVISNAETFSGNAGNITMISSKGTVSLSNSMVTTQVNNGSGNTGNIKLEAPHGDITLNNSFLFSSAQGTGTLGGIQITANNLILENGASILGNNFTTHRAENIAILLDGRLNLTGHSVIQTATPGSADAADLAIRSRVILISEKSKLETTTISSGDAGRLSLLADHLEITDGGNLLSKSQIAPGSVEIPSGRGGAISIEGFRNPGTSVMIDGPESGIFTSAQGTGRAGNIDVKATSLNLQNGGTISAETTGTSHIATGGSIIVNATDHITLTNGSSITASSRGPADAGKVSIEAGQQLDLLDRSSITTTTESKLANGGNINIRAIDRIRVVNSTISTSVKGAEGSGGNIFIDPNVVILEGSNVTAQAIGGSGGNITFVTPLFLADPDSVVSATSQRGVSGTVTIQSPTSNLSGTVGQLVSKASPPQVLLQNRCVALAGGGQSTFLLAGRDALPTEPGGWLTSPISMEHVTGEGSEQAAGLMVQIKVPNGTPIVASPEDEPNMLSLRRLTPQGFLVRTFATGSTGCPS